MRMNQEERRFDFHGLGAALKRAREEKGWTQAYVAELVDRDSRTIMNIENKGQYPSFDLFVNSLPCLTFQLTSLFMRTEGQGQVLAESTLMCS
jgi:transcriptional regulator with XRE-family HTH domain